MVEPGDNLQQIEHPPISVISCRETLLCTVEHAITPSQPLRIHLSQSCLKLKHWKSLGEKHLGGIFQLPNLFQTYLAGLTRNFVYIAIKHMFNFLCE